MVADAYRRDARLLCQSQSRTAQTWVLHCHVPVSVAMVQLDCCSKDLCHTMHQRCCKKELPDANSIVCWCLESYVGMRPCCECRFVLQPGMLPAEARLAHDLLNLRHRAAALESQSITQQASDFADVILLAGEHQFRQVCPCIIPRHSLFAACASEIVTALETCCVRRGMF